MIRAIALLLNLIFIMNSERVHSEYYSPSKSAIYDYNYAYTSSNSNNSGNGKSYGDIYGNGKYCSTKSGQSHGKYEPCKYKEDEVVQDGDWAELFAGTFEDGVLVFNLNASFNWLLIPDKSLEEAFSGVLSDVDVLNGFYAEASDIVGNILKSEVVVRLNNKEVMTAMGVWRKNENGKWKVNKSKEIDSEGLAFIIKEAIILGENYEAHECTDVNLWCEDSNDTNIVVGVPVPASFILLLLPMLGFYRKRK